MLLSPLRNINPTNRRKTSIAGNPPVNTVAPVITGTLNVGSVLTCSNGTWINGVDTYDYQWKRGVTNIGTNSPNYTQVWDDINQNITCTVTATNAYGNSSQVSNTVVTLVTLEAIYSNFVGYSAWSSVKSTDVGTTTTWQGYGGVHNLANPSATNQPTANATDSDFNNKKTYTFATDDYLIKNFNNYGSGRTSGSLWFVIKTPATLDAYQFIFGVCNSSNNLSKLNVYIDLSGEIRFLSASGAVTNIIRDTTPLSANTKYIIEVENNGSSTSIYINGTLRTTAVFNGSDGAIWFAYANTLNTLTNISIGARINTVPFYYNGKIAYVGDFPLLSSGNRADMFSKLNNYFNVY